MSAKVIAVEELEQILLEYEKGWEVVRQTGKGPEPEFRQISGEFDPRCLIEAAREREQEFPWLPKFLETCGNGRWKYGGFVVFDLPQYDGQPISGAQFSGSISLNHKTLGQAILGFSNGRIKDIELIALLY